MTAPFLRIVAGTARPDGEPAATPRRNLRAEYRSRTGDGQKNMHTYLFRSREALLEADEAELIRDVCSDIDKAQRKLEKLRTRIGSVREHAANELQLLAAADTKLTAAIVAALLSQAPR